MGTIRKIRPVKYFTAIISVNEPGFETAEKYLTEKFGPLDLMSEVVPFIYTDYYKREMGVNLLRKFVSFRDLRDPAELADVKIYTNQVEAETAIMSDDGLHRRINLDPGYVDAAKMILATTKDNAHRIYLQKGIFAEITLSWHKKSFHPLPHTYPDYRTPFYIDYFNRLRHLFMKQSRK